MISIKWWRRYAPTPGANASVQTLKQLVWLYLLLWFVEGAIRKWIFPAHAGPLVLMRDPVALLIVLYAIGQNVWRPGPWAISLWAIGALSFLVTLGLRVPVPIALIGLRTLCLHFPLIFIFDRVLIRADVEQAGNLIMDLSLPMGLLMVLQFASPAGALINAGAGLDAAQIEAVEGRIRAPGVFSYITGVAQYYSLVMAFLLNRLVSQEKRSIWPLTAAAIGVLLAVSVAISRTLTLSVGLVGALFVIGCLRTGIPARKLVPALAIAGILGLLLSFSETVREGLDAFILRWTLADHSEGSIGSRVLRGVFIDGDIIHTAGLLGRGLGVGTNMAAKLMTGDISFLLAEVEWDRVVLEMGAPLGLAFILWRVTLTFSLGKQCFDSLGRKDILPLVLFASAAPTMLNGQTGMATTLGFLTIAAGLALVAAGSHRVFIIREGLLVRQPPPGRGRPRQMIPPRP